MGDAGGVRRLNKRRLGDSVSFVGDESLPKGVMSPKADRRCVERSLGNSVMFLMGDRGNSGAGMGDWMLMLFLLKGEVGNRCGIFIGVLKGDVIFSCSSSEARPRFVLNLFVFCDESLLNGDVIRMFSLGIGIGESQVLSS